MFYCKVRETFPGVYGAVGLNGSGRAGFNAESAVAALLCNLPGRREFRIGQQYSKQDAAAVGGVDYLSLFSAPAYSGTDGPFSFQNRERVYTCAGDCCRGFAGDEFSEFREFCCDDGVIIGIAREA